MLTPAARNNQPIRFCGTRTAKTAPMTGTAMFAIAFAMPATVQVAKICWDGRVPVEEHEHARRQEQHDGGRADRPGELPQCGRLQAAHDATILRHDPAGGKGATLPFAGGGYLTCRASSAVNCRSSLSP